MIPGITGSLISTAVVEETLRSGVPGRLGAPGRQRARARLVGLWRRTVTCLGPASAVRRLFDEAASPLIATLGFTSSSAPVVIDGHLVAPLGAEGTPPIPLVVGSWSSSLARLRTDAIRLAARPDARWCLAFCGHHLVLIDTHHTYARAYLQFHLEAVLDHDDAFTLLWAVLRAEAFTVSRAGERPLLEELVDRSERHRVAVCGSLHRGVRSALVDVLDGFARATHARHGTTAARLDELFEQALRMVYRVLFLLFAEARRLVPTWHPTYRDGYTLGGLTEAVVRAGAAPPGLWEALAAISRLSAAGCTTPDLVVTAFNGDLFAPLPPLRHADRLDGDRAASAIRALGITMETDDRNPRSIAYDELGVEQLGSVYETVLDYRPTIDLGAQRPSSRSHHRGGTRQTPGAGRVALRPTSHRRKTTGTYYTPRSVTDYLVRRSLGPLVQGASPSAILDLRIVDPAMGSGAFLVSACQYLSAAYEEALIREGTCSPNDVDDHERAGFRRTIAQRCLYGVDRNPMAVELARLSLWLTTLAADRPLTFLSHHLRVANSLVGASPDDVRRQPPGGSPRVGAGRVPAPLFDAGDLAGSIGSVRAEAVRIAVEPGDSLDAVRAKQRLMRRLSGPDSPLRRWRSIADLWCAYWFWPDSSRPPVRAFPDLVDWVATGRSALPAARAEAWVAEGRRVSAETGCFHWGLEFPEVFYDAQGRLVSRPGFDAAIGNPPWNMLRADTGPPAERRSERDVARRLVRFCQQSGTYETSVSGHVNLYQLFLDRSLSLVRDGGRLGMVLPAGLLTDRGSARLRQRLLSSSAIDALVEFENRRSIFPIHRGVRFVVLTARRGSPTKLIPCRFREQEPSVLDDLIEPEGPHVPSRYPVVLSRELLERISGADLSIPQLARPADVSITDGIYRRCARLGSPGGWRVKFGRELNATEDRPHFEHSPRGVPVIEGKQISPFRTDVASVRHWIGRRRLERRFGPAGPFTRPRLAYRNVAAASNRLTLIAAMLPAEVVTTHTVHCVRSPTRTDVQWFLCGVLNSYVANYLVRLTVGTHVTVATVERLPVPTPPVDSPAFRAVVSASRRASREADCNEGDLARLQAHVALLYGLEPDELEHVLETFPLVPRSDRAATSAAFQRLASGAS